MLMVFVCVAGGRACLMDGVISPGGGGGGGF